MEPEAQQAAAAMERYCRGEPAAFHQLYALLAPRILAYLRGLLGDRAAAEDALQLTFLKVHEARATYLRGANPIPWIYTIAHRTSLDEIRKRKRSRVRLSPHGMPGRGPATEPAAHITGVAADRRHAPTRPSVTTRAAPPPARWPRSPSCPRTSAQALLLTKVHGRSVAEAAMITGSTPGAIKQRAHRAYVTLRRLLGKGGDGGAGAARAASPPRKEMA